MHTTVTWLNRLPFEGYFSIETVFKTLEPELINSFDIRTWVCPRLSAGLTNRLLNLWRASLLRSDLFHVTGDVHYLLMVLPGKKTILTIHDLGYLNQKPSLSRWIFKWFWVILPVKRAAKVTVISENSKQVVVQATGCDPNKVIVIPNPVHPRFQPNSHRVPNPVPVILQVGVKSNKNLERLAEALEGLKVRLEILGKPTEDQVRILQRLGIEFHVQSGLTTDDVASLYQSADLVVFASTFEGFGLPILEAQASATPVIVSGLSPMSEVAGHGAVLVNPFSVEDIREKIIMVLESEKTRTKMVYEGIENAKRYQSAHIASQYKKVYEEVFQGTSI